MFVGLEVVGNCGNYFLELMFFSFVGVCVDADSFESEPNDIEVAEGCKWLLVEALPFHY
jgi:hypothetical protein